MNKEIDGKIDTFLAELLDEYPNEIYEITSSLKALASMIENTPLYKSRLRSKDICNNIVNSVENDSKLLRHQIEEAYIDLKCGRVDLAKQRLRPYATGDK